MFPAPPPTVGSVCSHVGTGVGCSHVGIEVGSFGAVVGAGEGPGDGPGDGGVDGSRVGTGDGSGDGDGVGAKVGVGVGSELVSGVGSLVFCPTVGGGVEGRIVAFVGDGDGRHEISGVVPVEVPVGVFSGVGG